MVNLDPAAEHFKYPVTIDVRELISLEDVMEETEFGPNGGAHSPDLLPQPRGPDTYL